LTERIIPGETELSKDIPTLRIGFTTERKTIEFDVAGKFSLFDNAGITLAKNVYATSSWHLHVGQIQPANYYYNILLGKFRTYEQADELCYRLLEKGIGAQIKSVGGGWPVELPLLSASCEYWVVVDQFSDIETAHEFTAQNLTEWPSKIFREKQTEPSIRLQVLDSEMEIVCEAINGIHVLPETPETLIKIKNIDVTGVNNPAGHTLVFSNRIEFRSTNAGQVCIAMENDAEKVLSAMLTTLTFKHANIEFLKALAVVLRSNLAAELNQVRTGEVFDVHMNHFANAFLNASITNKACLSAISETNGTILMQHGKLIAADYSESCGGCTEQLTGDSSFSRIDAENEAFSDVFGKFNSHDQLTAWINAMPDLFCNPYKFNGPNPWGGRFRWTVEYDRATLEKLLSDYAGQEIGELYDVIPLSRSASGRVQELEMLAGYMNLMICGEENIRRALGYSSLHSTCFYIERALDEDSIPSTFTIHGAGAGHGRGLCLAGAAELAQRGHDFKSILLHYFENSELVKLY
jgi:hypothetical protein